MRVVGSSTGSSPRSTSKTANCGTYFPITTSNTVRGVESKSPIGPQSQVQKTADTRTAIGDTPVLEPRTFGSTAWLTTISMPTNIARVTKNTPLPGNAANAKARGTAAPSQGPMYGM